MGVQYEVTVKLWRYLGTDVGGVQYEVTVKLWRYLGSVDWLFSMK